MSKTKIMKPYTDSIATMMQRERITDTGAYETLKSTPSIMNDTSAHVMKYISY